MENVNTQGRQPFTNFWNRVKYRKEQKLLLWDDLEIPAKLFYKISETNDLQLLILNGKPTLYQLEKAWFSIIDKVFEVRKDSRSQNIQEKRVQIAILNYKIKAIEAIIGVLYGLLLTEKQQNELIETLKRLKIYLKNPSQSEIKRVLQRDLRGLRAKLKIQIDRLKEMSKPLEKKAIYEQVCLSLSRVMGFNLGIEMTLGEFLAAEHLAGDIVNKQRKKKNG